MSGTRAPLWARAPLLCVITTVMLLSWSPVASAQEYSCDAIMRVPAVQRCAFVRSNCSAESILPYSRWYHCHVAQHGIVPRAAYVLLVACLLPLCFCLLGDTAEFYFSPIMAHVSQSIPKMRPRFAGVTFVALGNGAPDLSSNIAAIQSGEVLLSAGGITGGAMFVQCIVAAELIAMSADGVKCAGAMTRDVAVYCVCIASVLLAFAIGTINRAFVGWAISMYVIYVIWVFAGDEWHERGRPDARRVAEALRWRSGVSRPGGLNESLLPWASAGDLGPAGDADGAGAGDTFAKAPAPAAPEVSRSEGGAGGNGGGGGGGGGGEAAAMAAAGAPAGFGGGPPRRARAASSPGGLREPPFGAERPPPGAARAQLPPRPGGLQVAAPVRASSDGGGAAPLLMRRAVSATVGGLRGVRAAAVGSGGGSMFVDARTYRQLVWADMANDAEEGERIAEEAEQREREAAAAEAEAGGYQPPRLQGYEEFPSLSPRTASPSSAPASPSAAGAAAGARAVPQWLAHAVGSRRATDVGGGGGGFEPGLAAAQRGWHPVVVLLVAAAAGRPGALFALWQLARHELTMRACDEWDDGPRVIRRFRQVTFPLLLPVYAALRATVPFIVPPGYSRPWLIASVALWPAGVCAYLGALSSGRALLAALAAGGAAAAAVAWLTRGDAPGAPPLSALLGAGGGGGAAGVVSTTAARALPGALSVMGFIMGVAWIDTVAGEVVGALSFLSALASFPAGVAGLTLLAWGNSLGDFFGNRAMARAGHGSIATTACFAAPLFNLLVSLALGFGGALAAKGAGAMRVTLTPEVALGCAFLIIYNLAIVAVGRATGRLPRWFAVFARAWYGLYFVVACASGFGAFGGGGGGALR